MSSIILALSFLLPSAPAHAGLNRDAAFAAALDSKPLALEAAASKRRARWDDRLRKWLGPFDAAMSDAGLDPAAMAAATAAELGAGRYDALILGESHSVAAEQRAAGLILRAAASARPVGAIIFENTDIVNHSTGARSTKFIFPDTDWLAPAGIAAFGYKDHFNPEADLRAGLKAAGAGVFVSYTGSAHSCDRVKDHILHTLKVYFGPYGRTLDLTTVEDVLRAKGRKPLIVAMVTEDYFVSRLQTLAIADVLDSQDRLEGVLTELDAAAKAWETRFQSYPSRADIRFVKTAQQSALFLGMTPGDRRPAQLSALLETLRSPELAAWLGGRKIKGLEAGRHSVGDAAGRVAVSYRVAIRDHKGGEFTREVAPAP